MKRFRFSEQAILTLRQQEKRTAEAIVLRASLAVADIEREIESLQRWLLESMQSLTKDPVPNSHQGAANASRWRTIRSIQNGQRQLSQCHDRLAAANASLDQSRNSLRSADITVKTLEKLKEKRFADHRHTYQAKQQQLSDESTMRMWMSQQHEVATDD